MRTRSTSISPPVSCLLALLIDASGSVPFGAAEPGAYRGCAALPETIRDLRDLACSFYGIICTKGFNMDFIAPDHELTEDIIRCAVEVHRVIGPGLKEEVYEAALEWELVHAGHQVARQVPCPVTYKGVRLETKREDKRIDMLVDGRVVLELKATPVMEPVFKAQCFTYVKMLGLVSGLVLNFGRVTLKEGIARVINETKAEYRTRLLREDPRAFRNLLVEEDGITLEEANRMQLAGDIGLHTEGSALCRGLRSGETEAGGRS